MPATERRPVLMVLLDALRHDADPDWAAALGSAGGVVRGAVRESFGFQTRPAYFAGLHPEESGMATMLDRRPGAGPFRGLRHVPGGVLRLLDRRPLLSRLIRRALERGLRRRGDAVALYGSTLDIPLHLLADLDFPEKELPWEGYGGHPSLFSLLADRGDGYAYVGYPFVRDYGQDAASVETLGRRLRPETRLAFLQLNDLDGIGHARGPESTEYAAGVEAYGRQLGRAMDLCRGAWGPDFHIVAFGDHGMVPVERTVDIAAALDALPDRVRRACTLFLDSTLARVWCRDGVARQAVEERLRATTGGRVLDDEDRAGFRIRFGDDRLGQIVWLADPGTLIYPNFFGRRAPPPRGMHGYDPDHPANLGALAIASPDVAGGDVGVVDQVDLFPTTLELLGLPLPSGAGGRSVVGRRGSEGGDA